LRLGGKITIFSGLDRYCFGVRHGDFRGKPITYITCSLNGKEPFDLPFTTDYGKTWAPWQALRELESNVRDEAGSSSQSLVKPQAGWTTINLTCEAIEHEYQKLHLYFLCPERAPRFHESPYSHFPEIHRKLPSAGNRIYYRGVYIADSEKETHFTYNFSASVDLTEDRTLTAYSLSSLQNRIARALVYSTNETVIETLLTAKCNTLEGSLQFTGYIGGDPETLATFIKVVESYLAAGKSGQINAQLLNLYYKTTGKEDELYIKYEPNQRESRILAKAERILTSYTEYDMSKLEYRVVSSLPDENLGLSYNRKIYISKRCLDMGLGTVVSTLFEEAAHHVKGFDDESRKFQNYLMDTIGKLLLDLDDLKP
jgi:hypothetical protein